MASSSFSSSPYLMLPVNTLLEVFADIESRSIRLPFANRDYQAYIVPVGGGVPRNASNLLPAADGSAPSNKSKLVKATSMTGRKVAPTSTDTSEATSAIPRPSFAGALTRGVTSRSARGSSDELEGSAEAYVHTAPSTVASCLLDIGSPLFLFGPAAGKVGDRGVSGALIKTTAARGGPAGDGSCDVLAPLVIDRVGESEMQVLHYRRARGLAGEVIVELLSRVVRKEGGAKSATSTTLSGVLVFFEPVEEAALGEEAAKKVTERRARVRQTCETVPAKEQGYVIMMVRLGWAGSKGCMSGD